MSEETLDGRDFVAAVRVYNAQQQVVADVGETCERVPPQSLGWLSRDGLITRKAAPPATPAPPDPALADPRFLAGRFTRRRPSENEE